LIYMDRLSSELTKYAANAMLATRISFMNELSQLCEASGADIRAVRNGIGTDPRIGLHFIYPGIGYGGSCFPKDVQALIDTASKHDIKLGVLSAVHQANMNQREWFFKKIKNRFSNNLKGLKFAVWGLAFKPGTDDIRESPAIDLAVRLVEAGAEVSAFDPVALQNSKVELAGHKGISFAENAYDVLKDVDALILATEWREFRSPDFPLMKKLMKASIIFDGRNQYNANDLKGEGFEYHSVGAKSL
jgi:UDPglucose 6-dehydrogenase